MVVSPVVVVVAGAVCWDSMLLAVVALTSPPSSLSSSSSAKIKHGVSWMVTYSSFSYNSSILTHYNIQLINGQKL